MTPGFQGKELYNYTTETSKDRRKGLTLFDTFKRTSVLSQCVGRERLVGLRVDGVSPSTFRCTFKPCHGCETSYRSVTECRLASCSRFRELSH